MKPWSGGPVPRLRKTPSKPAPRLPNAELPVSSLEKLHWFDVTYLLRRQLPRGVRRRYCFMARMWEEEVWIAVHHTDEDGDIPYHFYDTPVVCSCKQFLKARRYNNMMVNWATMDPEMLAYLIVIS